MPSASKMPTTFQRFWPGRELVSPSVEPDELPLARRGRRSTSLVPNWNIRPSMIFTSSRTRERRRLDAAHRHVGGVPVERFGRSTMTYSSADATARLAVARRCRAPA